MFITLTEDEIKEAIIIYVLRTTKEVVTKDDIIFDDTDKEDCVITAKIRIAK